MKLILY